MIGFIISSISEFCKNGLEMYLIFIVLIVGFIIQFTKVVIDSFRYKRFVARNVFSSGGFPSFHTGLTSSVTMLALLESGFDSLIFAITFSFSILFAYDAMNLRFEAGQHAHYINNIRLDLQGVLTETEKRPLKERIGHTPIEVLGGMLFGLILTFILYYYSHIG